MKSSIRSFLLIIVFLFLPLFLNDFSSINSYNRGIVHEGMMYDGVWMLQHDSTSYSSLPANWDRQVLYDVYDEIMNTPTVENPSKKLIWELYEGSDWEDEHTSTQFDHAWNPYNLYGITPGSGAGLAISEYYDLALLSYQSGDLDRAYFHIGRCLHLIQDCTVPMHAHVTMNQHHEYESLCDQEYYNYIPYSALEIAGSEIIKNYYVPPRDWNNKITPKAWIQDAALKSYDYYYEIIQYEPIFKVDNPDVVVGPDEWITIAGILMPYATRLTASFLLYFYIEANNIDFDKDGLSHTGEKKANTDYTNPDTDGDKISDANEVLKTGTDPLSSDTDKDKLTDFEEIYIHLTDPLLVDSDLDNLSDFDELQLLTNPLIYDSDGDLFGDGEEFNYFLSDPLDSSSFPLFITPDFSNNLNDFSNENYHHYFTWNDLGGYLPAISANDKWKYRLYEKQGLVWLIIYPG